MDTAMRDMEQIQERDYDDGPSRKLAMLAMAALSTVGLVFAMGVLLGRSSGSDEAHAPDPLAGLDQAFDAREGRAATSPTTVDVPRLDRREMTFHSSLLGDERPEVAAAMAAAAAELAHLEPVDDYEGEDTLAFGTPSVVIPPAERPADQPARGADAAPERQSAAERAPAGNLAMGPVAVSAAEGPRPQRADEGSDGRITLQVISYRAREEADVFAEALRTRGHAAFVIEAEVPERGTYYRVRIGPFPNLGAAERYRAEFESAERMNTFLVRRRS